MSIQEEKKAIVSLLTKYDHALNSADSVSIPYFYTKDGLFMPQGMKAFSRADLEKQNNESFFNKVSFQIDFTIKDIVVDGHYAFAQAMAKTNTQDLATGKESAKTSRDLFIFRKDQEEWKIYLYMFNNVKAQQNQIKAI